MEIHDMSMVLTRLAEAGVLSTEATAACSEAAALLPKLGGDHHCRSRFEKGTCHAEASARYAG